MYGKWLIGMLVWCVCTAGIAATAPKPASVKISVNIDGPNPASQWPGTWGKRQKHK